MKYFLNEDKTYRECELLEWSGQIESMDRHVGRDRIGDYYISTVWLGLDHNYSGGEPLLFETMVFAKEDYGDDLYLQRYSTWQEAEEGHKVAVEWVNNGCQ